MTNNPLSVTRSIVNHRTEHDDKNEINNQNGITNSINIKTNQDNKSIEITPKNNNHKLLQSSRSLLETLGKSSIHVQKTAEDCFQTVLASGTRRKWLQTSSSLLLSLGATSLIHANTQQSANILGVRVWPADEYTRVTIESDAALLTQPIFIKSPPRLAVDINGVELSNTLRALVSKIKADDPYIFNVRVGQNTPNVVRLVFDLKQPTLPQVFNLPPISSYQHRLVLDLYPTESVDPLDSLINEKTNLASSSGKNSNTTSRNAAVESSVAAGAAAATVTDVSRSRTPTHSSVHALSALPTHASAHAPQQPLEKSDNSGDDLLGDLIAKRSSNEKTSNSRSQTQSASIQTSKKSNTRPSSKQGTDRLIIVALDPGHGGEDPGAVGPSGTREKDVVLKIAHLLRARINSTTMNGNPMRAFMTRDADFFVPLQVRVAKARKVQADLFISIHADAFVTPTANGASVFALSQKGASSSAARWMAERENQSDLVGGLNVKTQDEHIQRALLDMSTTAQINDSLRLGRALLGEIGSVGRLHKPQVEQASFAVLKAPDIPSVLLETAFISNPAEEAKLRSSSYQTQLAQAVMRGIEGYFAHHPPLARNRGT